MIYRARADFLISFIFKWTPKKHMIPNTNIWIEIKSHPIAFPNYITKVGKSVFTFSNAPPGHCSREPATSHRNLQNTLAQMNRLEWLWQYSKSEMRPDILQKSLITLNLLLPQIDFRITANHWNRHWARKSQTILALAQITFVYVDSNTYGLRVRPVATDKDIN